MASLIPTATTRPMESPQVMPDRPIQTRRVTAQCARAILRVEKTWEGSCVVLGSTPTSAIRVTSPTNVVVPLYDRLGPISQKLAATTLRRVSHFPADLFLVEVSTPAGVQGYGMVAVPQALEPRFLVEEG